MSRLEKEQVNSWYKAGTPVRVVGQEYNGSDTFPGKVVLNPWQLAKDTLLRGYYLVHLPGFKLGHCGSQEGQSKIKDLIIDSIHKHKLNIPVESALWGSGCTEFRYVLPGQLVAIKQFSVQQHSTINQLIKNFDLLKDKYE